MDKEDQQRQEEDDDKKTESLSTETSGVNNAENNNESNKLSREKSSFLTGAEESGEAAVALGETLDKCADAIDSILDEIKEDNDKKEGEESASSSSYYTTDDESEVEAPEESEEFAAMYKPTFSDKNKGNDAGSSANADSQEKPKDNQELSEEEAKRIKKKKKKKKKKQALGVAAAAGVTTTLVAGPMVGLAAAGGAALLATKHKGKTGDMARAGGQAVLTAGTTAGRCVKDFEKKHNILGRGAEELNRGMNKGLKWFSPKNKKKDGTATVTSPSINVTDNNGAVTTMM